LNPWGPLSPAMSVGGDGRPIAKRRKGRPTPPEKPSWPVTRLLALLDLGILDDLFGNHGRGRKGYGPSVLVKCLLLVPLKYKSRRELTRALKHYPNLREAIGLAGIPDRTTFSHFEKRIGPRGFILVFLLLAWELAKAGVIIGKTVAMDATVIQACSKPRRKGSRKRPADPDARWGYARREGKRTVHVFGYKAHVAVDTGSGLPIAFWVTPGNRHEIVGFWRLLGFVLFLGLRVAKVLGDAAYDALELREAVCRVLGATPMFALNVRRTPGRSEREKRKNRAMLLREWHREEGLLGRYIDPRGVRFKGFFKQRTSVERNNGNGKENFGLNSLKLRGLERTTTHVALCLSAELAVALAAHRVGRPDLIRSPSCFRA